MGQIKNIKLHIVTDIKSPTNTRMEVDDLEVENAEVLLQSKMPLDKFILRRSTTSSSESDTTTTPTSHASFTQLSGFGPGSIGGEDLEYIMRSAFVQPNDVYNSDFSANPHIFSLNNDEEEEETETETEDDKSKGKAMPAPVAIPVSATSRRRGSASEDSDSDSSGSSSFGSSLDESDLVVTNEMKVEKQD